MHSRLCVFVDQLVNNLASSAYKACARVSSYNLLAMLVLDLPYKTNRQFQHASSSRYQSVSLYAVVGSIVMIIIKVMEPERRLYVAS